MPAFVDVALYPPKFPGAPLVELIESLKGSGLSSVVGGKDHDGVIDESFFFEYGEHFPDLCIGLDDKVSVVTGFGFSLKLFVRDDRVVWGVEGEVGEKGFFAVPICA